MANTLVQLCHKHRLFLSRYFTILVMASICRVMACSHMAVGTSAFTFTFQQKKTENEMPSTISKVSQNGKRSKEKRAKDKNGENTIEDNFKYYNLESRLHYIG